MLDLMKMLGGFFFVFGVIFIFGFGVEILYMKLGVFGVEFYVSFGFFYFFVGFLLFVFFICLLRMNFCFVILFFVYMVVFFLFVVVEWVYVED